MLCLNPRSAYAAGAVSGVPDALRALLDAIAAAAAEEEQAAAAARLAMLEEQGTQAVSLARALSLSVCLIASLSLSL